LDLIKTINSSHVNGGAKNCCVYIVRAGSRFRINKKFAISKKKTNKSL